MAIDILSNCHFDATRVSKLYLGVALSTGGTINFPVNYHTLSGSSDSIIKYESWDATNVVQIGQQNIQFEEVYWAGENITFTEELIIDQRGRNYVKTLTFELSGIDQTLVDQLEALGLDHEGMLCPPKTLAILIDENENELIAGYDFPFRLESITTGINGDQNSITLTYISNSHSRARNVGMSTPLPSPSPSITPSISLSITPTCARPDGLSNLPLYYSETTLGDFTDSLNSVCNAFSYWYSIGITSDTGFISLEAQTLRDPNFIYWIEPQIGQSIYTGYNGVNCEKVPEGYYLYWYVYKDKEFNLYYYLDIMHIDSNGIIDQYKTSTCPTPTQTQTPSVTPSRSLTPSTTPSISISITPSPTPSS